MAALLAAMTAGAAAAGAAQAAEADAAPASGAVCGTRAAVVARLQERFGETRRGYGVQRGASVVEVFASTETGSWTILATSPNGVACLVAAGDGWAPTPDEAAAPATAESPA